VFKDKYGPWALIIGGSEGIGVCLGEKLAAKGLNVALTARKQATLDEAAAAVRKAGKVEVRTLSLDMTAPDMMARMSAFTKDMDIGLVIYNAGAMDRVTTFLGDTIDGHLHTIRLNCEGPARIAHHFGEKLKARGRGGFVLESSLSALAGSWGVPIYGATKAFDLMLAEGLWYEWKDFGIDVVCVVIGGTRTPSSDRLMGDRIANPMESEQVAQEILDNVANGPVYYVSGIQQIVPHLTAPDRRAAVVAFGDNAKDFFKTDVNRKPYDPNAVVR
jgi:short-subunit dehydrogenase